MKQQNTPPRDLRHIEVPEESMEAMARQIRALERRYTFRRRMAAWSAVAAVAVIVAVAWSIVSMSDTDSRETTPVLAVRQQPASPSPVPVQQQPAEVTAAPSQPEASAPQRPVRRKRHAQRPVVEQYVVDNVAGSNEAHTVAEYEDTAAHADCQVMVYESGNLVACGSLESVPEVYEIFQEVAGAVQGSRQVVSSGIETFDNIVKTVNSSEQQ